MEDKGLTDILSNLIPDPNEGNQTVQENQKPEQDNTLADGLETLAGRSGGELKTAIDEFLKGKGDLFESARNALAIDTKSAEKTIVEFLTEKFDLSPTLAAVIAPMLLKLIPGAEKKKKKTSTKRKKKTTTSAKKKKTTTTNKPKKKTTTSAKKKTSPTTKKKPAASPKKKTTTKKTKPKTSTKTKK